MGYYIETGTLHGKAAFLVDNHGGEIVFDYKAQECLNLGLGVVCVVNNGSFEAAGFMYSQKEFDYFNDPADSRIKTWVVMDREIAEKLSGYKKNPLNHNLSS